MKNRKKTINSQQNLQTGKKKKKKQFERVFSMFQHIYLKRTGKRFFYQIWAIMLDFEI